MTKHIDLNHGDVLIEPFVDALGEFLGAAAPSFSMTLSNSTTISVAAGTGDDQVGVAIKGKWRYRSTSTTAAHPGGAAGTYDVFVTGSDNSFTLGGTTVDNTVYNFGVEIKASGATPATAIYRKVGEVDWDGSAITAIRTMVGQRRDNASIQPTAPLASVTPLRVRGAASQSAALGIFQDSAGTALVSISAAGQLVFGADTNLYRSAADTLKTDDALIVVGAFSVTGGGSGVNLNPSGGWVRVAAANGALGFYGANPVAQQSGWGTFVKSDGNAAGTRRTLAATYTPDQLLEVVASLVQDLKSLGLIA